MKTAIEINQSIKISDYLEAKGIFPHKCYNGYLMYKSPLRTEKSPSFKVSQQKNLWIDYGTNEGGTLIDLVLKMHPYFTVSRAIMEIEADMIADSVFSFQPPNRSLTSDKETDTDAGNGIEIYQIKELGSNPALTAYLQSRAIQLRTAKKYCKEVYFNVGDKQFFGIGTKNENGWAIRNKFWKGCSGQGVSLFKDGHRQLAVFEGIFDLLSHLELEGAKNLAQDFLVLNSLVNIKKSMDIITSYDSIVLMLDRDKEGQKASAQLTCTIPKCYDVSESYEPFKDLNDYLVSQNPHVLRKVGRGR